MASNTATGQNWPCAAIFDCDGLLVDSTHCWHRAYEILAEEAGQALADLDLEALAGASVASATAHLQRDLGVEIAESRLRSLLRESFAAEPPTEMAGARALAGALAARGPIGVASNAPGDLLERVLEDIGLRPILDTIVSAEQTPAEKPAPDVYLEACRRLGVSPSDAIAFEDSPLGVRSALTAGLFVVAVPSVRGMRMDADLIFPRLDDPRLTEFLKLDPPAGGEARSAAATPDSP